MPNEIYHRSEWGNPKAEGFGDVYFDASATNKLYKHSDNYENSDGTDKILRDIPNKASIVLTPTAYSDGSLNTVIPPYQVLPQELVTNGNFDTDSDWIKDTGWTISGGKAVATNTSSFFKQNNVVTNNKIYKVTFNATVDSGRFRLVTTADAGTYTSYITADGSYTFYMKPTVSLYGGLEFIGDGYTGTIDNVSVKEIQEADFDFSRGSSATRVNEKGLIEDVQILSGNLVQNGDFGEIGSELVINGDFDTDSNWSKGTGWSISGGKANADATFDNLGQAGYSFVINKIYKVTYEVKNYVNGNIRFQFTGGATLNGNTINSNGIYTQYVKAIANHTNFRFRGTNFTGSIDNVSVKEVGQNWEFGTGWGIEDDNNNQAAKFIGSAGNEYLRQNDVYTPGDKIRLQFTLSNFTSGKFRVVSTGAVWNTPTINSTNGTFTYDIDTTGVNDGHIYLQAVGGSFNGYVDDVSVIEITDDTDIPRIDYTSGQGALLLEPQSTNLVPYSEDFSQSVWTKNGVLIESGYTAPDGNNTAYKVTDNGSDAHLVMLGSVVSPLDKNKSIWARTVSGTGTVQLLNHNSDTSNIFNLTTQWQRFDLAHTGLSHFYAVDFRRASTTLSEVVLWGAQMEDLSYATSYIPTEGATVTRSADVANNSGNADLINSTEGVLYAEIAALADDGTNREITLSDGTIDNYVLIRFNSGGSNRIYTRVDVNTSIQYFELNTSYNITNYNKIAIRFKNSDFATFINGTKVDFQLSGNSFPSNTLNKLNFDNGGGYNKFHGNVKSVAVFKEALTDAELQALTT